MRNSVKPVLRALAVAGAIVAVMGSPMAHADDGGYISNINNHNTYEYEGLGAISLDNVLGTSTESSLLSPIRFLIGSL